MFSQQLVFGYSEHDMSRKVNVGQFSSKEFCWDTKNTSSSHSVHRTMGPGSARDLPPAQDLPGPQPLPLLTLLCSARRATVKLTNYLCATGTRVALPALPPFLCATPLVGCWARCSVQHFPRLISFKPHATPCSQPSRFPNFTGEKTKT